MTKQKHYRLANLLAALAVGTFLLTALSLVVNHIELSMSVPGNSSSGGAGLVESTHAQLGFRNGRMYASCVEWLRPGLGTPLLPEMLGSASARWDWLVRVENSLRGAFNQKSIEINGWMLGGLLGVYPLLAAVCRYLQTRRERIAAACRSCGYNLTGNESGICPECGSAAAASPHV